MRRALFGDPVFALAVPGVEIERRADGKITLRTIGPHYQSEPSTLASQDWATLIRLEPTAFTRPKPVPPSGPSRPEPSPVICHGWIMRFAAADAEGKRTGSWTGCGSEGGPNPYAAELARLSVAGRADCAFDPRDPLGSFRNCFNTPRGLRR